jgi:hypothetical protein
LPPRSPTMIGEVHASYGLLFNGPCNCLDLQLVERFVLMSFPPHRSLCHVAWSRGA